MIVCQTPRLTIRHLQHDDADFIVRLLNEPAFIKYIADKGVRNRDDAIEYLETGPIASYQQHGFGSNIVIDRQNNTPVGMCGVLKRPELSLPDLGYSFLSEYWGQGFATEAVNAVLANARSHLGIETIAAITTDDNEASIALLVKVGFRFIGMRQLHDDEQALRYFEKALI